MWTEVDLKPHGTTHLIGENLDEGGSSGAGKTTLISAMAYCLYDKIPSGVSKDRLINRTNEKKITLMEVELEFERNGNAYKIRRFRGSSNGVQLFENDKDITPDSIANFNDKVEELLGFSYNLFAQIILFNGNSRPFLDLSVSEQRNLIEELFRITTLSKKANALKRLNSETDKSIAMQKLLNKQHEAANDLYRKHLAEAKQRITAWENNRQQEINKLTSSLENLSKIDFSAEEQIHTHLADEEKREQELKQTVNLLQSQIQSIQRERFAMEGELVTLTNAVKQSETKLTETEKELVHLRDAKCPYCLQGFADAPAKIFSLEEKSSTLKSEIHENANGRSVLLKQRDEFNEDKTARSEALLKSLDTAQAEVSALSTEIKQLRSSLSHRTLSEMVTARESAAHFQEKIQNLSAQTNPHIDAYDKLVAEGEIKVDYDAVDELLKLAEHQTFLIKLLTDKNSFIRKNIISKTIPFLNKRIAYYTEKLNLPHIVLFQPDMSCEITQYGRELDHGNLSNGEKKKLNLSLCLAFRDVLTYLHAKVSLLLTDEVDGGSISGNDVDALIGLLKRKAWDDELSIYIVSHRPEFDGRCDRNLVIRKEAGFSTLITQPD